MKRTITNSPSSWRNLSHVCRTEKNPAEHNIDIGRCQDDTFFWFMSNDRARTHTHTKTHRNLYYYYYYFLFWNRDINLMRFLRSTVLSPHLSAPLLSVGRCEIFAIKFKSRQISNWSRTRNPVCVVLLSLLEPVCPATIAANKSV